MLSLDVVCSLKKVGGYIDRNAVEMTLKIRTVVERLQIVRRIDLHLKKKKKGNYLQARATSYP